MSYSLSVIVPIYNSAHFLRECLQSVLAQRIENFEIICINDGSRDNSLEILTEFAHKDNRIVIINQENQGVSAARNAGLEISKGEYIGFVDSDDCIAPDYFELFLKGAEEDVISTGLNMTIPLEKNKIYNKQGIQNVVYPIMLRSDMLNSCCTKIFRSEIIKKNHLRFPVGVSLGEDAHFILKYLQYAQTFKYIENPGYYYRENIESATRIVKNDIFFNRIFEVYDFDHKNEFLLKASQEEIQHLKIQRLIGTFIANLSLFLRKNPTLEYAERKRIIKKNMALLANSGALDRLKKADWENKSKFEIAVLNALRKQNYFKIYCLYKYSHWRNHIK